MFYLTPWTHDYFPTFSEKCMSLSSITEKRFNGFSIFFFEKDGHDTWNNLEHFRDVTVNPLNPGSIYIFPGSVFVCNIMEKRVSRFPWFFMKCQARHQKKIARRFHTCLDCFTVSHQGTPGVFVSMFVSMIFMKFSGYVDFDTRNNL